MTSSSRCSSKSTSYSTLPPAPRVSAEGELDALEAVLPRLGGQDALGAGRAADAPRGAGWRRLLDSLVQVRRSGDQDLLSPADRQAGSAALALEIALARSALANGDETGFRRALARLDGWLLRLYPDGPLLRERRARLAKLRALELHYDLPIAGAALKQLQALQHERRSAP
jgi:uroporphyrin-3 C-methyltransferase